MKNALWITTAALTIAAITGSAALAHDGNGRKGGARINFDEVDANSDGKITVEEISAHAKARFDAADTNKDGQLSAEELAAQHEARMKKRSERHASRMKEKMMDRMDANKDGMLSFEEMSNADRRAKMFDRLDADEDGAISKEEFAKMKKRGKGWGAKHKDNQDN